MKTYETMMIPRENVIPLVTKLLKAYQKTNEEIVTCEGGPWFILMNVGEYRNRCDREEVKR